MNNQRLGEASFVVSRGEITPGSWGRMQLAALNNSVGCQGNKIHYSRISSVSNPCDKECCLAREPYPWEQSGRGTCSETTQGPPSFHQMSMHIFYWPLILGLIPQCYTLRIVPSLDAIMGSSDNLGSGLLNRYFLV